MLSVRPGSDSKDILSGEIEDHGIESEKLSLGEEDEFVRKLKDPKLPSQEEVDRHFAMGHFPYRDWCHICVRAHGKELEHRRDAGKTRDVPEYSFDYCFPGDELGFKWTVLVGRERMSRSVMCTAIAHKGGGGKFSLHKCFEFFEENGDQENKIIVKNDQEPSIQFLMKDMVEERKTGQTLLEESAKYSSGSNGIVERSVEDMEARIRAVFLSLQERLGVKIDARERIVAFIPEYVAYLYNRLHQGQDGKVAYERIKGKRPTVLGVEFGEKVLYKIKHGTKLEKINPRWEFGIVVGVRKRSNEVMISTKEKDFVLQIY